jgi:hypothetical protein
MCNRPPTKRIIDCAEDNANFFNIDLPEKVYEEFMFCKWFNIYCWELRPPRYQEACYKLELCDYLGIHVTLSQFKTELEFEAWFAASEHHQHVLANMAISPF